MESFGLLIGHLLGDYILQNDWMAGWKGASGHILTQKEQSRIDMATADERDRVFDQVHAWSELRPPLACTLHCALYTLAVWLCACWWMPWWGPLVVFATHWPMDRYRLASWWMKNVSGQETFAGGVFAPWAIIVVDNTIHLLVLFLVGLAAGL